MEDFDSHPTGPKGGLNLGIVGRSRRFIAPGPIHGLGSGILNQLQEGAETVSLPNDKSRTRRPQSPIEPSQRFMKPATGSRAQGPIALGLRVPDEYGNDGPTVSQGGVQSGIIIQAQVVAKPEDGGW
jgi:hypothetical protein